MNDDLKERLRGIKIDMSVVRDLNIHDANKAKEAHDRLDYLEDLSGKKLSLEYRDGFVQGYIEASWKSQ